MGTIPYPKEFIDGSSGRELLEIFQLLIAEQSSELKDSDKEKGAELVDITYYLLRIADIINDLEDAVWKKMKKTLINIPEAKVTQKSIRNYKTSLYFFSTSTNTIFRLEILLCPT